MGPETFRIGPLACYAQWTLETAIGNLGREIRQDRDLFANLTQRAVIRAQVNSLCARFPRIKFEVGSVKKSSHSVRTREFEGGYIFLPRCEEFPSPLTEDEHATFKIYWREQGWPNVDSWPNAVCRWAKLRLPNGQMARSVWLESNVTTKLRRTSCIKREGGTRIGNIEFYFYIRFGEAQYPLAMVSLFSLPDAEVLSDSSGTVYLSESGSAPDGLVVIPVTAILSVVSMFPEMRVSEDGRISETRKFSLMRHAFIDLAHFSNGELFDDDDDSV
ncbi:hypothetical protein EDB89DRAFT_1887518 [Lactarius sanguifluus]|nr:hypothetical protein EDB89DRAFT_1897999 [Lactarius sanguifluus]KAH9170879.1 hypothetical protein EDB89DRAFT_1887518 [Lactarius sanguifluus]